MSETSPHWIRREEHGVWSLRPPWPEHNSHWFTVQIEPMDTFSASLKGSSFSAAIIAAAQRKRTLKCYIRDSGREMYWYHTKVTQNITMKAFTKAPETSCTRMKKTPVLPWLPTRTHSQVSLSGGAPSDQKSVSLAHRVEAQLSQVIVQPHLRPFWNATTFDVKVSKTILATSVCDSWPRRKRSRGALPAVFLYTRLNKALSLATVILLGTCSEICTWL